MTELMLAWAVVAYTTRKVRARLRPARHEPRHGALHPAEQIQVQAIHELVEEYRTGELPKVVDDFAEWDTQLGVAVDRCRGEVTPIAAQLVEPAPFDDSLLDFTGAWRRTQTGFVYDELYTGAAR